MVRGVVAAACLAGAVSLGACGGDDDGGGGSAGAASTPAPAATSTTTAATGAPIKVMAISAVDTPIQDYPDVFAGAQAAADAINAEGGVQGHPIEVVTCNDKSDPNGAEACARKAVQDKVVAATGSTINGARFLPVLDKAGIQDVGLQATDVTAATAPNAWPLNGGTLLPLPGVPRACADKGAKKVVMAVADLQISLGNEPGIKAATDAVGSEWKGMVKVPIDATDFAPYVQQIKDTGGDCVVLVLSESQIQQLVHAGQQLGLKVTYGTQAGSLGPATIENLGATGNGMLVVSPAPYISSPEMQGFVADLDKAKADNVDGADIRRLATQQGWLGVQAIAAAAGTVQGEVDAASLTKALETAKDLDVAGIYKWTPATPGPKDYPRIGNGTIYPGVLQDGQIKPAGEPFDLYKLLGLSQGS